MGNAGDVYQMMFVFWGGVVRVIIALRLLMVLGLRRAVAARIVTRISRHDGAVSVLFGVEVVRQSSGSVNRTSGLR